jgi:hypothetical protein
MKEVKKLSPTLLAYRAEEALREAVAEAIAEYRHNGVPIAIWRNGKVVRIPSDQIEVREPQVEYKVSCKKRNKPEKQLYHSGSLNYDRRNIVDQVE